AAQDVIGKVGPQTLGVERMLRRAGFRYANRIDPFDGGPHFVADRDEVVPIRCTARRRLRRADSLGRPELVLVGRDLPEPPYFVALSTDAALPSDDDVVLPADAADVLAASDGTEIWVQHFRGMGS